MNPRDLRDIVLAPNDPTAERIQLEAKMATFDQTEAALDRLQIDPQTLLKLPWDTIDALTGPIWPDDIWAICAATGNGKTTVLAHLIESWVSVGKTVYVVSLEQDPQEYRLALAALALGYHPQRVLENAWHQMPHGALGRIKAHIGQQRTDFADRLHFSQTKVLAPQDMSGEINKAVYLKADVVVLDHINHLDFGPNGYTELGQVCRRLKADAKELGLPIVMAAQMNRGERDPVSPYQPPNPFGIEGGEKIRQVTSIALGVYRPLVEEFGLDEARLVRQGKARITEFVERDRIAFSVMKARKRGEHTGELVQLQYKFGRIIDPHTEQSLAQEERYGI